MSTVAPILTVYLSLSSLYTYNPLPVPQVTPGLFPTFLFTGLFVLPYRLIPVQSPRTHTHTHTLKHTHELLGLKFIKIT